MKDLTLINTIGNQRVRDSDPDVFKIKGSVTYRFFQGLAIWTLKGGWVNLCDATKVNSKYRFFKKWKYSRRCRLKQYKFPTKAKSFFKKPCSENLEYTKAINFILFSFFLFNLYLTPNY